MANAATTLEKRLSQFWDDSSPEEQELLACLLADKGDSQVQGFLLSQRESLMTSILTNIANMKHESLKGIANNLRG